MSHPPERRRIARVLVVEDDDAQRQTLVDLMDSEAYQAIGCATAAEALEVTKTHSFGVAVVDLRLPDLSGTQLLERLREADCRTHVIIHTGYGSFDSAKDAINLGAFAYVEKLGDPAELVRQVHRALADQLSHYAADLEAAVAERTASLQASEQRFHQLFEEAPIAYQSLDETGHFLEVNQAWLTLLGYERREVLGRWFGDFLAPESQEQFRHRFPAFKRAGEVHGVEFTVVRKDGKHRIATFNGTIGRNEHGGFRQTHCVLQDITEHRRAEAARREQEDLLRSVIEGTDDAVFVKDTQGRYLLLNSADARGLGKPVDEIIGLRDRDLFPPEIADAVVKIDRQVIATGERRVYEQTFSLSDTDPRTYVVSKYPRRSAEGNITGVIGIARDITERIQREERLRVLERAVRQSTDGIAVADLEGSIQFINSAWAQMHGHGMTELIGQHLSAFHTPEQMIEDADPFNEQVMSNGAHQGEVGHVRADGSTFPAWMTATLLRDEQGAATGLIAIARDITERKQAEEALRESEERYRAVVDNIELGISLISTDYRILTTNAHTESDFDRSTCELIGEHCFAVFEKRDAPCPHCPGTIAMREHRPAECETEGVRDDGTRFPVRLQMFPMLDADKQIVGFVEVSEDITERKQAEAARAESEQRYRELFSHMTSGVAVYEVHDGGTRFTLTDMNASALRLCQVTRANVLERDITDVFPGMADFGLLDTLRDVWRTGEPKYHPCTQYRDERLQAWYENNVYRLPSGHVVAVFDDVTERMQAEEARRLERNRMMSILDAIPDGVYIVSQQWDIEYVNPVIEREFGPVDGRKCYEYFHNRTVTCPWCRNAEVFAGKSVRWEWHSFKNNRDYDLFDTPFRNADGSVSKFEIFHDITRRKQAEEELAEHRNHLQELVEERSRQLEESRAQLRLSERLASVGTLAAGIAHEINNPIGGILLAAQYALASEGDPALTRKALTDVVDHAQRSRDIVHSVLRFSGEASVEKTAEHLNDVVRHAIDAARPYADQRGCIISHVLEANLPCVDMNPIEMELVVTNLIRNAAEAGAAETRLETRATADTILLIVSDNGAGVSPEQKQRLFDPFYTTRRSKGGTGLGLSISHGIILDHGGTIDISGEPGTGMTATVTLPQSATAPAGEIRDA